ncbi:MAG: dihydroxyacetone kinase subunit L [Planctomycetes bacterium]|nr:dihydroxyacetone kinase subunit L [Planctomycetota bacterium]
MADTIGCDRLARMLRGAAAQINTQHEMLSRLDAATGDGDHGTTMRRAMTKLEEALAATQAAAVGGVLNEVGWAILGVDGGATGPLLGTFFMGMAEAAGEADALDTPALAAAFEGALAALRQQTKAQVGDKTMIDALVPAVEALRAGADAGDSPAASMARAAEAARRGAEGTKDLQARFGRARNLGERSIGSADPGATSIGLIFRGFADALASEG